MNSELNERDRDFYMERRRGLLTEIKAIEKRFPGSTVTLVIRRDEAEKRGLLREKMTSQ